METIGLPLLEAKAMGCPIIAIDMPYVKETLEVYKNYSEFDSTTMLQKILKTL